jgi:replicative DNA helicase
LHHLPLWRNGFIYLPERDLIVYLLNHEYYKEYYEYIDQAHIKENYRELSYLYRAIKDLHERFPDRDHTLEAFKTFFFVSHPDVDRDLYGALFEALNGVTLDPEVGVGILKQIKERKQALDLAQELLKFATGYSDLEKVKANANEFLSGNGEDSNGQEVFVSTDLEFLLSETLLKRGLRWRLNCLNRSLGSLRRADFGVVFARPETGKTTFLASEITHMLTQLSDDAGPIIWFNNEQAGAAVMLRVYQGFFGITMEQVKANPKKWKTEFQEQTKGKFLLLDDANIERRRVDKIMAKYKPSLVCFDQLDKIQGFEADREDLKLGDIYIWGREVAKAYCPVIGVCQADGTAENIKWLTMAHMANAKTAKQAECDWILGIGKVHAEGTENTRYLNISKNKLMGDDDHISALRHGRFEVYMEQEKARYRDIVNYD